MMKTISLVDDYKINDAGNEDKITSILDSIKIEGEQQVIIDLSHCIIDYPATSMLIDTVLFQLAEQEGEKNVSIYVSYFLPEQTLLNDLLGDSKFFQIEAKTEIPMADLKKKIENALFPKKILMKVVIKNRAGFSRAEYEYGNK